MNQDKKQSSMDFDAVIFALPLRIIAHNILFTPSLPADIDQAFKNTATWMAPHAKIVVEYESAFWKEQGFSGQAHSRV